MPDLNEKLLQFIWQHRLLNTRQLRTTRGKTLTVLSPGQLNANAGPDFFNGQIKLDEVTLAGNIEIHLRTSDWLRHRHQHDKNYDRLILHAVYEHDTELLQNSDNNVEVVELKNFIDAHIIATYAQLSNAGGKLACSGQLGRVNELKLVSWLGRMTIERLEEKVKRLETYFNAVQGDYTQTFYILLMRSFGFGVNALPFELLARQLPVQLLLRHADNLQQLEALLLGMAGMLEAQFGNQYVQQLQNEFEHLKHKYALVPLQKELFKYSRMRPANFPSLRLAQVAMLVHTQPGLLTSPQSFDAAAKVKEALAIKTTGHWQNHYTLDGDLLEKDLQFGEASAEIVMINALAPFLFFYGKKLDKPAFTDLAVDLLDALTFEKNHKTKLFAERKNSLKTAAYSQALINLHDHYCIKKQCLKCGIAASLLSQGEEKN